MTQELTKAAQQALEACPFCGADPHDAHHIEYGRWAVTCRCGASGASANTGPNATDSEKIKAHSDARTAWNTRALTQRPAAQEVDDINPGEREKAEADAVLYGTGYIVDGRRVAPHRVRLAVAPSLRAPQQATPDHFPDAGKMMAPEPLTLGPLAKRNIYDAIRGAYDLGYNDARNARTVPGDSAPGYDGRSVEEDHGGALFNTLNCRLTATPEPVGEVFYACPDELEMLRQRTVKHCLLSTFKAHGEKDVTLYTRPAAAPAVTEIDYTALIHAAFATNKKWAQGTNGCIAFKRGAEWFRDQLAAAQAKGCAA